MLLPPACGAPRRQQTNQLRPVSMIAVFVIALASPYIGAPARFPQRHRLFHDQPLFGSVIATPRSSVQAAAAVTAAFFPSSIGSSSPGALSHPAAAAARSRAQES